MARIIEFYRLENGIEPFIEWLESLRDKVTQTRIRARLRRLESGNYGDHKRFSGLIELRLDFGKGYRVYCAEHGRAIVVLLIGGDKGTQSKDIEKALVYLEDYYAQKKM
jgi:putative addiction module killer protein